MKVKCQLILYAFLLLIISDNHTAGDHYKLVLIDSLEFENHFLGIDDTGNFYGKSDNQLIKKDKRTGEEMIFSDMTMGQLTTVNFDDPLNIILFYAQTGYIVFLDRQLGVKQTVNIEQSTLSMESPGAISYAANNGIWSYFPMMQKLTLFDNNMEVVLESENLGMQVNLSGNVKGIKEVGQKLFLMADKLYIFDIYGNLLNKIEIHTDGDFYIEKNEVYYLSERFLHVYDFFYHKEDLFLLPLEEVRSFFFENQQVFLQKDKTVYVYALSK